MAIFVTFYPLFLTYQDFFTPIDRLLLLSVCCLSLIAIPIYLYGTSKMIYLYLLKGGLKYGIYFCLSVLTVFTAVLCLIAYLIGLEEAGKETPVSSLILTIEDYVDLIATLSTWFVLVLLLNLLVARFKPRRQDFVVSRFLWSTLSLLLVLSVSAPAVTTFMQWPSFNILLLSTAGLITLGVIVDWVFFCRSSNCVG